MELEKILQRLKEIRPDADYTASSRRIILATERPAKKPFGVMRFIFSNIQSASAIALMSFLFVLIFGGFSVFKILNPFRLSSLDPVSLRAEADAIDTQLQVAGVTYDGTELAIPAATGGATTTAVIPRVKTPVATKPPGISVAAPPESTSSATSSISSPDQSAPTSSVAAAEPAPIPASSTPPVVADPVSSALDILSN